MGWDTKSFEKHQAGENNNYRECVKEITPIFLSKLQAESKSKNPIIIKENSFSIDLTGYEEGDIPKELGENLLILRNKGGKILSALNSNPGGQVDIDNLKLKVQFRVEVLNDVNSRNFKIILRTRDDDLENDITIKMKRGYIYFSNIKADLDDIPYKVGKSINSFILYAKEGVVKFYVNDAFIHSQKIDKENIYGKIIIKELERGDYIYDVSGYNILR